MKTIRRANLKFEIVKFENVRFRISVGNYSEMATDCRIDSQ